ncbi:uncharacterized protein LOC119530945 [Choloepus didactylus]|uniref:uncharacterized protein LOC119530945 n=1 Tax=Choloepus didactylus TaxID=27675 RepID=UPI00189CD61F|nr:uncharacterized protein LOC119530945 [Choloepus didactylus]
MKPGTVTGIKEILAASGPRTPRDPLVPQVVPIWLQRRLRRARAASTSPLGSLRRFPISLVRRIRPPARLSVSHAVSTRFSALAPPPQIQVRSFPHAPDRGALPLPVDASFLSPLPQCRPTRARSLSADPPEHFSSTGSARWIPARPPFSVSSVGSFRQPVTLRLSPLFSVTSTQPSSSPSVPFLLGNLGRFPSSLVAFRQSSPLAVRFRPLRLGAALLRQLSSVVVTVTGRGPCWVSRCPCARLKAVFPSERLLSPALLSVTLSPFGRPGLLPARPGAPGSLSWAYTEGQRKTPQGAAKSWKTVEPGRERRRRCCVHCHVMEKPRSSEDCQSVGNPDPRREKAFLPLAMSW